MVRREGSSKWIFLFFITFLIWILLQFIAPFALQQGRVDDLSGHVGLVDNIKLTNEINSPWNILYGFGDNLCHQKAERSFFINGNQMPFCSRCTAIWLGLAIGIGLMVLYKIELNEKFIFLIIIGIVPIAVDGIGQLFYLWESTNLIRLITGLFAGIICGIAIALIIDEIISLITFKKIHNKPI